MVSFKNVFRKLLLSKVLKPTSTGSFRKITYTTILNC